MLMPDIKEKLSSIVGSEDLIEDREVLSSFSSGGMVEGGEPALVVRPSSTPGALRGSVMVNRVPSPT